MASVLVVGCGHPATSVSDGPELDAPSARVDALEPDAPPASCDLLQPFSAAAPVPELFDPKLGDSSATLTDDELSIFFQSEPEPTSIPTPHIYTATRATRDAPFGPRSLAPGTTWGAPMDGGPHESSPVLSPDGKTLY